MGKISKKYIGPDQVGSVQLELENALSLRAKNFAGSSVDLLEYNASDELIVQQHMNLADEKNIYSQCGAEDVFTILTLNSADLNLKSQDIAGTTGNLNLISGNSSAGDSGSIFFTAGTASGNRGNIVSDSRFFSSNLPHSGEFHMQSKVAGVNDSIFKFRFTDYGQSGGSAPGIAIEDAGSVASLIISSTTKNDGAAGVTVLNGAFPKASTSGTRDGGNLELYSGVAQSWSVSEATNVESSSGDISITTANAYIKGTGANASSGNISLTTGTKEGSGIRGSITLNALEVQCSSMQFKNAADPTDAQDLATKAYVDQQFADGTTYELETIALTLGMITAQKVVLSEQYVPKSLVVGVGQRVNLYEGLDFDVVVEGGVSVLEFTGPSAAGGAEELVENDILYIQGLIDISP